MHSPIFCRSNGGLKDAGRNALPPLTPKSETELDPEERLLRAIFGEKAADVKDSSLTVTSGVSGIVMGVEVERKVDPNRAKLTMAERARHIKETKQTFKTQYLELLEERLKYTMLETKNDVIKILLTAIGLATAILGCLMAYLK